MKKILLSFLLLIFNSTLFAYDHYIAVAAIFNNEAPYFREWIEYHKLLGVSHFYLYNNNSDDHYLDVLAPYIASGEVDLIDWPETTRGVIEFASMQGRVYTDALERSRETAFWISFIDIDEFLNPIHYNTLTEFLTTYENDNTIGVLYFPWLQHGTSNVIKVPEDKLMIEVLLKHEKPLKKIINRHLAWCKLIVRTDRAISLPGPHQAILQTPYRYKKLSYDDAQIDHYWSRDLDFFENIKLARKKGWGMGEHYARAQERDMNKSTTRSHYILRFVEPLRKAMGFDQ